MPRQRSVHGIFYSPGTKSWEWQPIIDGKRVRRRILDPDRTDAGRRRLEAKVRKFLDELGDRKVDQAVDAVVVALGPGKPTVAYTTHTWLRQWLDVIKTPHLSYNGARNYRYSIEQDILPALDDVALPDADSHHFDRMLARIRRKGSTDKELRAYETCRAAWNDAAARPRETGVRYNPLKAVRRPEHHSAEVVPFTVEEVQRFVAACSRHRAGARWVIGVTKGIRPGEARALMRDDLQLVNKASGRVVAMPADRSTVDLAKVGGLLWIRENVYRRKWLHGCKDPHACGVRFHIYEVCPGRGPRHDRYHSTGCGAKRRLCKPGCTEHAKACPDRHGGIGPDGRRLPGGLVRKDPKSRSGRRRLVLVDQETQILLRHLDAQDAERTAAGPRWLGNGALFATKWGAVMTERFDWGEFQEILALAGIDRTKPYTSRHAAATMMLIQGVDKRAVMDTMGWAVDMSGVYQHVVDEIRRDAAEAVGALVWGTPDTDSATATATADVIDMAKARAKRA